MGKKLYKKFGITFVEVLVATVLLALLLLPVFNFLTNAMKDTERAYVEAIAMARAKQAMDTILFQIPWRVIREGNPCRFEDPKNGEQDKDEETLAFMKNIFPEILGEGSTTDSSNIFLGDGLYKTDKGFWIRTRIKAVDLDQESSSSPIVFTVKTKGGDHKDFKFNQLTSKDADGKYNLVKKIIIQVKWSLLKSKDPNEDPNSKSLFLVGFKSNFEG